MQLEGLQSRMTPAVAHPARIELTVAQVTRAFGRYHNPVDDGYPWKMSSRAAVTDHAMLDAVRRKEFRLALSLLEDDGYSPEDCNVLGKTMWTVLYDTDKLSPFSSLVGSLVRRPEHAEIEDLLRAMVLRGSAPYGYLGLIGDKFKAILQDGARLKKRLVKYHEYSSNQVSSHLPPALSDFIMEFAEINGTKEAWETELGGALVKEVKWKGPVSPPKELDRRKRKGRF